LVLSARDQLTDRVEALDLGALSIDTGLRLAKVNGAALTLTTKERALLELLMRRRWPASRA
jgi:DNA-binding response OmpR family regulator